MFVDRVKIFVAGGKGGDGCLSFRREKHVPRGGPDGGDGGHGGSVTIVAEAGINHLAALAHRKHWVAGSGQPGQGGNRHGRNADELIIRVPPGTVVRDTEHGFVLKDLAKAGDSVIAARGGRGGKGNTRFKTDTNRAPREWTRGAEGESRPLALELMVIADVGLVGKPNAGKSTLLSRLSRARPEIADYPFTTKYPNLGLVQLDADRSFVMADIPGLIEGAHAGAGLGHEFLRHVQRAGILVHLVEPQPTDGSDPLENYATIRGELAQYDERLAARREIVVVTKSDLPAGADVQEQLKSVTGGAVLLISAVTGEHLDQLLAAIRRELEKTPRDAPETSGAPSL